MIVERVTKIRPPSESISSITRSASMISEHLPISVIVMTNNEEANIGPCLDTVVDWANEVFVVDSGSTDRTLEIVAKYTNHIVRHPLRIIHGSETGHKPTCRFRMTGSVISMPTNEYHPQWPPN